MTTCQHINVYPETFLRILTISWHVQAPVNVYAFYCIVFLSPKVMNTFRWHLFIYQFSSTFLDFTFAMGLTPVVIPEMTMGYSVGLYRNFMDCRMMLTLSLVCMTISASSIVEIFFWRWQNIILPSSRLKLRTLTYSTIWIFALTLLFLSIALIHQALDTEQYILRLQMRQTYSCIDFLLDQPGAFICEARKYFYVVIYGVISCCIGGFFMVLFLYQSLKAINSMAFNHSLHSRNVQRRLIVLLCAQLLFPLGAYAVGGSTIVISLSLQLSEMQQAFNFAIFIFSNYGSAASLCTIFCNEPYWRNTKRILCCGVQARKKELTVVRVCDRSGINS